MADPADSGRSGTPRRGGGDPWPRQRRGPLAWWRDHRRIAADTVHYVSARLGTSLLVWLLVGIALALPAGLMLLQLNLADMTSAWDGRPGLSVYFELTADEDDMSDLGRRLEAETTVAAVAMTSREQALAEFQDYAGVADALSALTDNPLPASLRATLVAGTGAADLERLATLARTAEGVADVVLEKTWLERINDISRVVSRLGLMLAILFGLGAVLVTSTSVRLAIEARLEELRVQKLVGATDAQIRRPFLYFGLFYGLGGGLVAAMLLSLGLLIIENPLIRLLGSYGQTLDPSGFDPLFLGALLTTGGALGVAGSLLAASQRLTDLEIL